MLSGQHQQGGPLYRGPNPIALQGSKCVRSVLLHVGGAPHAQLCGWWVRAQAFDPEAMRLHLGRMAWHTRPNRRYSKGRLGDGVFPLPSKLTEPSKPLPGHQTTWDVCQGGAATRHLHRKHTVHTFGTPCQTHRPHSKRVRDLLPAPWVSTTVPTAQWSHHVLTALLLVGPLCLWLCQEGAAKLVSEGTGAHTGGTCSIQHSATPHHTTTMSCHATPKAGGSLPLQPIRAQQLAAAPG